jgi:hypothetical protein
MRAGGTNQGRDGHRAHCTRARVCVAAMSVVTAGASAVVACTYSVPDFAEEGDGAPIRRDAQAPKDEEPAVDSSDAAQPMEVSSPSPSDAVAEASPDGALKDGTVLAEGGSHDGGSGADASPLGSYGCTLSYVLTLYGSQLTPMGAASLTLSQGGGGLFDAVLSGSGATCSLTLQPSPNGATMSLDPPQTQTCSFSTSGLTGMGTFTMGGTATITPSSVSASQLPFALMATYGGFTGSGTGSITATCAKM